MLFTCSLTRAVYLEILPTETTRVYTNIKATNSKGGEWGEWGEGGRPKVIHSDNAKTFERASKWIKRVYKDAEMQKILVTEQVK